MRKATLLVFTAILCLGLTDRANAGVPYTNGDIFVAVGFGKVIEFTPTGVPVQTLDDGTAGQYVSGMAFDANGNLYATNSTSDSVSKFDNSGNLSKQQFINGTYQVLPESISLPGGQFPAVVGDGDKGFHFINTYDSTGTLIQSYDVKNNIQNQGTDWLELLGDGKTVLYTSEGDTIFSYDISLGSQNLPVVTGLPSGGRAFQFRLVLSGPYAGDYLVADGTAILLVAPGNGNTVKTYNPSGNAGHLVAISLSPDGTAFWTTDYVTGLVWEIDIASGFELEKWNSNHAGTTLAVAVYGEQGQSGPGYLEICKQSDPNNPVTGTFDFTATNGNFHFGPISVPVGQCSGSIPVPSGVVTVAESPQIGVAVDDVTAIAYDGLGYRHDVLDSWNVPNLYATMNVLQGDIDQETLTTFTNYAASPGVFKLCKIGGDDFTIGQPFVFTVTINNQSTDYTITAGPPQQGGNCVLVNTNLPVNTPVKVTEHFKTFFRPTMITVNEGQVIACTPPSIYCGIVNQIPGITEMTFTNVFHFDKRCMECDNIK